MADEQDKDLTAQDQAQPSEPQDEELEGEEEEEGHDHAHHHDDKEADLKAELKEAIDVQVEDLGGLRRKLTISIPAEKLGEKVDKQYDELRREAAVPGFRKGRAPRRLLEKRFADEVGETLVQQLIGSAYMAALEKTELKTVGDPLVLAPTEKGQGTELLEVDKALPRFKIPAEGPLTFSCEVELRPTFETPDLTAVTLKRPKVSISDEDVEEQVRRMAMTYGTEEPVEGAVAANDVVVGDIKITSGEEVLAEQADARLRAAALMVGGIAFQDLGDKLTGANVGQSVTISATLPDDYSRADLRGKPAELNVTIKSISRHKPLDEAELVKNMGFEKPEELRAFFREMQESQLTRQLAEIMRERAVDYLIENIKFDLPERLTTNQYTQVRARMATRMYHQGLSEAEVEQKLNEGDESMRSAGARTLRRLFILDQLAEKMNLEVTEADVNAAVAEIARSRGARFDRVRDELIKSGLFESLYLEIRDNKVLDQVVAGAKIEDEEVPAKGDKAADATEST